MEWYNIALMILLGAAGLVWIVVAIGGVVMVKHKKDHGWKVAFWATFMFIETLAMAARMGAG